LFFDEKAAAHPKKMMKAAKNSEMLFLYRGRNTRCPDFSSKA
jgi:hypothetical protein